MLKRWNFLKTGFYEGINFNFGPQRQQEGRLEESIAFYDASIAADAGHAEAYVNRGTAYLDLDQTDRAVQDFDDAISLDPTMALAYNNRGLAYVKLGQHEKAIADLTEAIRLNPQLAVAYNLRALAHAGLERYREAQQDVDEATELGFDTSLTQVVIDLGGGAPE